MDDIGGTLRNGAFGRIDRGVDVFGGRIGGDEAVEAVRNAGGMLVEFPNRSGSDSATAALAGCLLRRAELTYACDA